MPTLAEIRDRYPQYRDLTDQQLADGLYRRFYSDLPRAQFDAKVGLAPGSNTVPAGAQGAPAAVTPAAKSPAAAPAQPQREPGALQRVGEAGAEPYQGLTEGIEPGEDEGSALAAGSRILARTALNTPQAIVNVTAQALAEVLKKGGMEPNSAERLARDIKAAPEAFAGMLGGGARAPARVPKVAEAAKPAEVAAEVPKPPAAKEVMPDTRTPESAGSSPAGSGPDKATPPATETAPGAASPVAAEGSPLKVSGGSFEFPISGAGKIIGTVSDNTYKISIAATAEKGKGAGTKAYADLAREVVSKGGVVESDRAVSAAAAKIYEKLKQQGFAVEKNPMATAGRDGSIVSPGWVYRITGVPAEDLAGRVAAEGPLSRPPAVGKPREMEDQLFQLRNLEASDRLDALTAVKKLPEDYTPELDQKLYHFEEDPKGVALSERERAIYDEHVKPIREEANALSTELNKLTGVTPDVNEIYTPRYVAGRTRSYGESIAQWMKGVEVRFGGAATRTMRKTVDAQKGRDFFIAEHPETGDRVLVYVAPDRKVLAFDGTPQPKSFGRLAGSTGPKTGAIVKSDSGAYRLAQATTKEIEAQAQTRYIKSVMANRLDNLAKLRSAVRNAKYIESLKSDPAFPDYFKPASETPVPPVTNGRQWRRPTLPQFQNFYVEPRIADALDDFARTGADVEGLNRALQSIGRAMNAVMFINPKAHIDNVFNHMLIGRGLVGNVMNAPSVVRNLAKGAREVWTLGPAYRRALKAGLSLPYARIVAGDLHAELLTRLGADAAKSPAVWNRLAAQLGYPSAKIMLKRWGSVSNRVLWAAQDAMMMSRVMELQERGIPIERAIRSAEKEIPNYRVPGQVLGKGHTGRGLAELFGNPAFGRFGRYQFGRLRAYADMLKDAFGPSRNIGERAHAFDQMLMLGVYTFGVYAAYDWLWQQVTGNPLAYTVRSGASAIPKAIEDVGEGRKKAGDLITSMFTLGVPIELASEIYFGRYGWSGQPVVRDADVRGALEGDEVRAHQIARDVAAAAAREFSTIGTLVSPSATDTAGQTALRAIGVVSPTPEQEAARARARALDERAARRRAYKQEAR